MTDPDKENAMTEHRTGTHQEWLSARLELLDAEKELTRRSDELTRLRQALPWVPIDREYRFETDEGTGSLADLFKGRSQLLVYHFMFGPDFTAGCPSCSAIADGFSGSVVHLANHDVAFTAVSRAPLAQLQDYKRRMGWTFPWASSFESDFNYDFHVTHTEQEWQSGAVEYNFRSADLRPSEQSPVLMEVASGAGGVPRGPPARCHGHDSSSFVFVVASPPHAALVAPERGAVEPCVHAPEAVNASSVCRVGVEHDAILEGECAHAGPLFSERHGIGAGA